MKAFETDRNQVEIIEGMTIEYPYCLHKRDLTDFVVPWHWHEELEWIYVESGMLHLTIHGKSITLKEGEFCFINSGELHEIKSVSSSFHHAIVFLIAE